MELIEVIRLQTNSNFSSHDKEPLYDRYLQDTCDSFQNGNATAFWSSIALSYLFPPILLDPSASRKNAVAVRTIAAPEAMLR